MEASKKLQVYLISAVISFMVIYTIYYVVQTPYQENGLTAMADSLHNTTFGLPGAKEDMNKNFITSSLIDIASQKNNKQIFSGVLPNNAPAPDSFYLTWCGIYRKEISDSLTNAMQAKITNHPPLDLKFATESQPFLFTYLFRNFTLPPTFIETEDTMLFEGKPVSSIMYSPDFSNEKYAEVSFVQSEDKKVFALAVFSKETGDEAWWISSTDSGALAEMEKKIHPGINTLPLHERIIMPRLDFFFQKEFKGNEITGNLFSPNLKVIEQRYKLKTTARTIKRPIAKINVPPAMKIYELNKPFAFYLKKTGAAAPYFTMIIRNPEVLIKKR